MKQISIILCGFLIFLTGLSQGQSSENAYPPDGVYSSFSAFRNGIPDLNRSQLIRADKSTDFTIRQWVNTEKLLYIDSNNIEHNFDAGRFWCFAEQGVVHLFLGNKFHKVHTLGQITYFLESYPTIKGNMAPVVTDSRGSSAYRFLDMETGDIMDYTVENLEDLLERDELLFLEYKSIVSLKEKKKKMFAYMEHFNNKHPLKKITDEEVNNQIAK